MANLFNFTGRIALGKETEKFIKGLREARRDLVT